MLEWLLQLILGKPSGPAAPQHSDCRNLARRVRRSR